MKWLFTIAAVASLASMCPAVDSPVSVVGSQVRVDEKGDIRVFKEGKQSAGFELRLLASGRRGVGQADAKVEELKNGLPEGACRAKGYFLLGSGPDDRVSFVEEAILKDQALAVEYEVCANKEIASTAAPSHKWAKEKLAAYRRILSCPVERGISVEKPRQWLKAGDASAVEGWLFARSALYDAADRIRHLGYFSSFYAAPTLPALRASLDRCTAMLNAGQTAEAREAISALVGQLAQAESESRGSHGCSFYPGADYNPCGWIKSFSIMKFKGHREDSFLLEPSPFNASWSDGVSVSFLKDAGDGAFRAGKTPTTDKDEYDFVAFDDATGFSFEKSWVSTQWRGPGECVFTFSVLSPLILCENVEGAYFGGLKGVRGATFQRPDGSVGSLDAEALKNHVFAAGQLGANWIVLRGKSFAVLVVMGVPPKSITCDEKGLDLRYGCKSFAAIANLFLGSDARDSELAARAERLSRMALAVPVQAVESHCGDRVRYDYLYQENSDAWGTRPLKVAPVPPLAQVAGVKIPGQSGIPGATRYGELSYVEGGSVSFRIPAAAPALLKGVNLSLDEAIADPDKPAKSGAAWVRLFIGRTSRPAEDVYAAVDKALSLLEARQTKVLLDPHSFLFQIHEGHDGNPWAKEKSVPTDPVKRRQFVELWTRLAEISQRHKGIVVGYDLYNELPLKKADDWRQWLALASEAVSKIRASGDRTPVYLTCLDMAGPWGFARCSPAPGEFAPVVYSFHLYTPHSFTHQKVLEGTTAAPFVFYPGWVPPIDWSGKQTYGPGPMAWCDRWEMGAVLLPAVEFMLANKAPMHCGEFAPAGYSGSNLSRCPAMWTRDACDWFARNGVSWHLWNMGFGLRVPGVSDEIYARWRNEIR